MSEIGLIYFPTEIPHTIKELGKRIKQILNLVVLFIADTHYTLKFLSVSMTMWQLKRHWPTIYDILTTK